MRSISSTLEPHSAAVSHRFAAVYTALAAVLTAFPATAAEQPTGDTLAQIPDQPTYSRDVAPIFQDNCVECHRTGAIGPFALTSYHHARNWANMIREVVTQRRMPPWPADPTIGKFKNARVLSGTQIATINKWVETGAPRGDPAELPPPKSFSDGWQIAEPDAVFELPQTVHVPATGVVDYQYYNVATNFTQDAYVQMAEARPGNSSVVHHIIVRAFDPQRSRSRADWIFVAGMAPGTPPLKLGPDTAVIIPRGSVLNFQMHYTPTGKPERDRSKIGFVFSKRPPRFISETHGAFNTRFRIPPGAPNHRVDSSWIFRQDGVLLSLMPHMHLRGKAFGYELVYPDGRRQALLSVPRYDFNWQLTYEFEEPIFVPRGSRLQCIAFYDNSANNPYNPNPRAAVGWGDQTWDEMMIGWFRFAPVTRANAHLVAGGG